MQSNAVEPRQQRYQKDIFSLKIIGKKYLSWNINYFFPHLNDSGGFKNKQKTAELFWLERTLFHKSMVFWRNKDLSA